MTTFADVARDYIAMGRGLMARQPKARHAVLTAWRGALRQHRCAADCRGDGCSVCNGLANRDHATARAVYALALTEEGVYP